MNKLCPPATFTTERLILRACRMEDAYFLHQNYTSKVIASEYLQRLPHESPDDTEKFIAKWGKDSWTSNENFAWSIILKESMAPSGLFLTTIKEGAAEIHFGIMPSLWGFGYVAEAGLHVTDWLKNQDAISRIYTVCDSTHLRAQNVLTKLGLKKNQEAEQVLFLPMKDPQKRSGLLFSWDKDTKE